MLGFSGLLVWFCHRYHQGSPYKMEAWGGAIFGLMALSGPWLKAATAYGPPVRSFFDFHPVPEGIVTKLVRLECRRSLLCFLGWLIIPVVTWATFVETDVWGILRGMAGVLLSMLMSIALSFLITGPGGRQQPHAVSAFKSTGWIALGIGAAHGMSRESLPILDAILEFFSWCNPLSWPLRLMRSPFSWDASAWLLVPCALLAAAAVPLWFRRLPLTIRTENPWVAEVAAGIPPCRSEAEDDEEFIEPRGAPVLEKSENPDAGGEDPGTISVLPAAQALTTPLIHFKPAAPAVAGFWENLFLRWLSSREKLLCEWAEPIYPPWEKPMGAHWIKAMLLLVPASLLAAAMVRLPPTPWPFLDIFLTWGFFGAVAVMLYSRLFDATTLAHYPLARLTAPFQTGSNQLVVHS